MDMSGAGCAPIKLDLGNIKDPAQVAEHGNVPNVFVDTVSWREEMEHTRISM